MGPSVWNDRLVYDAVSLSLVILVQIAYCWRRWHARTIAPSSLRLLIICALVLGTVGLVCIGLGAGFEHRGSPHADSIFIWCGIICVLSIWSFVVLDVLYPAKACLLLLQTAPFSCWGSVIFWVGLVVQALLVGLGLWQMDSISIDSLCAIPFVTHMNITAMAGYALVKTSIRFAWLWFAAGLAASAASLGLGIVATRQRFGGHPLVQCLICIGILGVKSYRDFLKADIHEEGLPQDYSRDSSSMLHDTTRPRSHELKTPSPVVSHGFQTHDSGFGSRRIELVYPTQTATPAPSEPSVLSLPTNPTPSLATAPSLRGRPDSGVGIISPPPSAASDITFASSTTAASEVFRRCQIGNMQFPNRPFSMFRVDEQMIKGYVTMDAFHRQVNGNEPFPKAVGRPRSILDVGTGTGDWAMDVAAVCPGAQVICTDLVPIPSLYSARNVTLYVEDANESDWGRQERFDLIHFRNMDGGIKDWEAAFKWAFNCQRAGGFLRLEQLVFYPPPDDPGPNSIWHALQQALDCIQAQKGLSFALQDAQGAQEKLEGSGYDIISNRTRPFHILPGMYVHDSCDLLWAIIELVKGVLVRGWELQPEVADKESLLSRLEVEFARGLEVKVITVIAQKPAKDP